MASQTTLSAFHTLRNLNNESATLIETGKYLEAISLLAPGLSAFRKEMEKAGAVLENTSFRTSTLGDDPPEASHSSTCPPRISIDDWMQDPQQEPSVTSSFARSSQEGSINLFGQDWTTHIGIYSHPIEIPQSLLQQRYLQNIMMLQVVTVPVVFNLALAHQMLAARHKFEDAMAFHTTLSKSLRLYNQSMQLALITSRHIGANTCILFRLATLNNKCSCYDLMGETNRMSSCRQDLLSLVSLLQGGVLSLNSNQQRESHWVRQFLCNILATVCCGGNSGLVPSSAAAAA